jgi:hypothetical protein
MWEKIDPSLVPSDERLREIRDIALEQYSLCASALNQIFEVCPDPEWKTDGIGSCRYDGTADDSLGGAVYDWKDRRQKIRNETFPEPLGHHTSACSYHQPGVGCILGELKSPTCLAHVSPDSLPDSFETLANARLLLWEILHGQRHRRGPNGKLGNPEGNWPQVRTFLRQAELVLADAKAVSSSAAPSAASQSNHS